MWDLIVSVPDYCLSFYFPQMYRKFCPYGSAFHFDWIVVILADTKDRYTDWDVFNSDQIGSLITKLLVLEYPNSLKSNLSGA